VYYETRQKGQILGMNAIRSQLLILLLVGLFSLNASGCRDEIFTGKREARGVWMSRFEYSGEGRRADPQASQAYIRAVFARARRARLNMVFFQVRGNGDAYYRSSLEPWAESLSGTLGQDPGWDPLAFATREAHALGLELHVWINTFPIWRGRELPPDTVTPRPIVLEHPEWLVSDSAGIPMPLSEHYVNLSPGVPQARQHILNVVGEIVDRYDIDGIHFDYIRYPEESTRRGYSHDSISVARFTSLEGNPDRLDWDDWQRQQVNQFVFDAYNTITGYKPWIKVSAAVIGKYTGSGWTGYNSVYQDPRRWMELGKMDFIVPMVYWERSHRTHPFVPLVHEWADRVAYDRQVLPGLSVALEREYGWSEIAAQIRETRQTGLPGVVFFAASSLERNWDQLGMDEFPYWSLVPRMPWKDTTLPERPTHLTVLTSPGAVTLSWERPRGDSSLASVVYRTDQAQITPSKVTQILWVSGRHDSVYVDRSPLQGIARYAVSTLDRLGNESRISDIVTISGFEVARR
jgi:uncharacterized lipoprotein YddW (UPF0748 family)